MCVCALGNPGFVISSFTCAKDIVFTYNLPLET